MNMRLIESMVLSKDEEVRKLAFNYIKINYDIDFKIYYDPYKFKYFLARKQDRHFINMKNILNDIIKGDYFVIHHTQEFINLILEYNEKYK